MNRPLTAALLKPTIKALHAAGGNAEAVARQLGLARSTITHRIRRAEELGLLKSTDKADMKAATQAVKQDLHLKELHQKISYLTTQNRILSETSITVESLKALIHEVKGYHPAPPKWANAKRDGHTTGAPTLMLSDIHFDEHVDPRQINGVNAYNRDIAVRRLHQCFAKTVDLCLNHMAAPKYDYFVLNLGGDLLSGNIHEELRETNEMPISLSMMALVDLLIGGIDLLANSFLRVLVKCVVGNHGRWDKKPRAKNRVYENYEWIVQQMLARHFANDDRVHFEIADGADLPYKIFSTRYLLTHGDQAKGGSGIAGALSPLMLMDHRKRKRAMAIHQDFDYLVLGHWHQLMFVKGLIVNGSVKGYDEWTASMNFDFEIPQQALWLTHPEHGITCTWPIHLAGHGEKFK